MIKLKIYIMMMACSAIIILSSVSCKNNSAKGLIEDFMNVNMVSTSNISDKEYSKIDSTFYINDSIINAMHKMQVPGYKGIIKYSNEKAGKKLLFMSITFKQNKKDIKQTFYFDENITHIVAFKEN